MTELHTPTTALPMPSDRPPRIMGFFAHPDDEVFCLGGTMAAHTARGAVGKIVSLTPGDAGQIRDASVATRRTLGRVRARELVAAASEIGVTDVACLHHRDGTLETEPVEPLVQLAVDMVDDFEPDIMISFGPDGAYGHPDHIRASLVATRAASRAECRPTMLHAAFPQSTRYLVDLLVEWLSGLDSRFRGSEAFAQGLMLFADGSSALGFAADHMDIEFFPAGTFIIEQGEPPGRLYLVLSGWVDVYREDEAGSLDLIGTNGPGGFFGEEAIATGRPRNAHVVARDNVTCFVLAPSAPSAAAGRGGTSAVDPFDAGVHTEADNPQSTAYDIDLDVADHAAAKLAALCRHRSQYALDPDMFPEHIVRALFGREYFRVVTPSD